MIDMVLIVLLIAMVQKTSCYWNFQNFKFSPTFLWRESATKLYLVEPFQNFNETLANLLFQKFLDDRLNMRLNF